MCASYMIKQRHPGQFKLLTEARIDIAEYLDRVVVPYAKAPVLVANGDAVETSIMKFSLVPSWSKEPKVKFATHNARLESIIEKPTWRTVFGRKPCLVILTDFIEPIYEGSFAGHMVAFSPKSGQLIYAAGVWDEWVNKTSGEVLQSFAIITHDPPPFVASIGHDRSPIFLDEDHGHEWLVSAGTPQEELKEFLIFNAHVPDLQAESHRPMRPGWEKRK
jgi:putative SOS response-associated peptidase YedK